MTYGPSIEQRLSALARVIEWPEPAPDLEQSVAARIRTTPTSPRRWPRLAVAVAAILVAVGVMLVSPGARDAIANLFGAGGVRIGVTPGPPPPSTSTSSPARVLSPGPGLDLGRRVEIDELGEMVEFTVRLPAKSPPDSIHLGGDGQVFMVWSGGEALPAVSDSSMLLEQTPARGVRSLAEKSVGPDVEVVTLVVEGVEGIWLEGAPHTYTLLDVEGNRITETMRLAGNVLLWTVDGVHHRLETSGNLQGALDVVADLEVLP